MHKYHCTVLCIYTIFEFLATFCRFGIDFLETLCYNIVKEREGKPKQTQEERTEVQTMTAQEKYQEVFRKNIDRMMTYQALGESARKRGDIETARKYRRQYTDLKAEIDAALYPILFNKVEN
jgi:nitrate reductase assembly molybdenum cofactor insertion protein NarJ